MSKPGPDQGCASGETVAPGGTANLSYFGQLAAANHVKKLVERYLSLAPVFIGGPANTSLELPGPIAPALNETEKGMQQMQNATFQTGFLPPHKTLEHGPAPQPFPVSPAQSAGNPAGNMFNPALYHPMAAVAAEQQSRQFYQIYRTMAIAAAHQQQQQLQQQQMPKPCPPPPPPAAAPPQVRPKRRRTSAGNDPNAPPSHLSGEMIRRLREKQKMKNAAAVASAVASVAAVTTSGGRQFDKPQPPSSPPQVGPAQIVASNSSANKAQR